MVKIKTPCIIYACDYHEFANTKDTLDRISNTKVRFKEFSPADYPGSQCYAAVFYVHGQATEANAMVNEHQDKEF